MMKGRYIFPTFPAGNIKADKEKSTEKIDGAIATIMGLYRAIRCGNANTESVYGSRGILFMKDIFFPLNIDLSLKLWYILRDKMVGKGE